MDDYFPSSLGEEQKTVRVFGQGKLTIENQVQSGLNLFLKLKSPAQMIPLLQTIGAAMPSVQQALQDLHYVHFARFLPSQDFSTLMVITVFDGNPNAYNDSLRSYLMDFVVGLGGAFNAILEFIQDAPGCRSRNTRSTSSSSSGRTPWSKPSPGRPTRS